MTADRYRDVPDVLALLGYTRPAWMADALCREHPEIEFVSDSRKVQAAAVQICGRCAVRPECLAYALDDPTLLGVWGGTTDAARKVIRRARRKDGTDATA